jgi:hypothetical protein
LTHKLARRLLHDLDSYWLRALVKAYKLDAPDTGWRAHPMVRRRIPISEIHIQGQLPTTV